MTIIKHRDAVTITVPAIGSVTFHSQSEWHLGARKWNASFQFDANGREYWGTVFRNGDVQIYTRNTVSGRARLLAESHKLEWRAALLTAGRAYLRPFQQAHLAPIAPAVEAGRAMARHMIDYRDEMAIGQSYQREQGYTVTRAFWLERCRLERVARNVARRSVRDRLAKIQITGRAITDKMILMAFADFELHNIALQHARQQLAALRATRLATSQARQFAAIIDPETLAGLIRRFEAGAENMKGYARQFGTADLHRAMAFNRDADTFRQAAHYLSIIANRSN